MSSNSIVARLGVTDTEAVAPGRAGAHVTEINFIDGYDRLDFGLGQALEQLNVLGLVPGERAVDLALVAATVLAADTRISREALAEDGWTREIELCVPVSEPAIWESQSSLLKTTLNFLTGDKWSLQFRPRSPSRAALVPAAENLRTANPDCVCLFSGGLDSFIGALDLFGSGSTPLLISHYWDGITSQHQRVCAERMKARFPAVEFNHIRARVGFPKDTVDESPVEDTLRGRSFMFFALAALAADAIGGDVTIHVPENGWISLNVPLDPLRLGSLSTRTTHPFYMARMNEFLGAIGIRANLLNRYAFQTKGQMAQGCVDHDFLVDYAKETMSCSSPGKTRFARDESQRQPKHCGYCVPCLIRRASLLAGDVPDDTPYQLPDLHAHVIDTERAEGSHIRSFQLAISRLRRKPERARFDIHRPGPLTDHPQNLQSYEGVYVAGLEEVARLLDGVRAEPL
jgi:7-cyano-7-deazaguanine synthase in queuosine biosynthesis